MSDIKVCTEEETGTPSDIVICDEEQTPTPQDIKVCEGDGRLDEVDCSAVPALTLSGDNLCDVGDVYNASGGTGNYTFSFSGGTIASDGEILTISSCGAPGSSRGATISVNDGCSSVSLVVRLTGGTTGTTVDVCSTAQPPPFNCTTLQGWIGDTFWNEVHCCSFGAGGCPNPVFTRDCSGVGGGANFDYMTFQSRTPWVCP